MDIINYPKALQTYLTVLHICEEKKDSIGIEATLDQIGNLFQTVKDYKKSIEYYNEAIKYGTKNMFYYLFAHVDISLSYVKLKQIDSARKYADKAYQIAIMFYNSPNKIYGGVLNSLGRVYDGLAVDSLAYNYLQRSYIYFTQVAVDVSNYGESTIGLANYFKRIGKMDSSIFYAKKCLIASKPKGYLLNVYESSSIIADYFQKKKQTDSAYYYQQISFDAYKTLYSDDASNQFRDLFYAEQQREKDVTQAKIVAAEKYASNLRLYALIAVIILGIIIGMIVYRNNKQKERAFELLKKQKHEIDAQKLKLEESFNHLQSTQVQLVQSEKMASLGELTAGIAHEIQNPLNFVNNFSEVNTELIDELQQELKNGNAEEAIAISNEIKENEQKINHHGKRADSIVKGMLQHSRSSSGVKEPTDINALADEYLRLSYHGLRAKDKSFNSKMETNMDPSIGNINIVPQDIGRVILNLFTNAFYVVDEKKKKGALNYDPTVSLTTKKTANNIIISVKDNGNGIAKKNLDKIFHPFFTTKPTGQGTGLGLSLSYDIVKAHGGELKVETMEGEGTEFIIILPK
jgi:signal transduction histidine kinase